MKTLQKGRGVVKHETPENGGDTLSSNLKDLTEKTLDSLVNDVAFDTTKGVFDQLLGIRSSEASVNDMQEGQEISLTEEIKSTQENLTVTREHMEYVRTNVETDHEQSDIKESLILKQQIEEIRAEIKRIEETSAEIRVLSKAVSEEPTPQKVGKYHVSFFEFVLLSLRRARKTMENSASFMSVLSNKRTQQRYWSQAKKGGSSFMLHHDRNVSTQTG